MPRPVPIIYTGKVATPNWSGFWSDFQTRQARNKQQRQQQAQFDALQNERILKDFLGSIDVDPINTANEGVQNRMNELSQGVEDIVTELLIKSGGKPSPQDRLEVQHLVNRTNQEVGVMKASLANRNADMKAFQKNAAWYDHDMIQENVYNWDGKSKYKSKLEDALIKLSPDEVGTAIRKTIKNANIFTETMERAGIKTTIGAKADPSLVKRNAETGEYENINDTQVAYMKHAIMGFDGGFRYNRAIDEYWATLDDDTKQSYENQAANADLEREDGRFLAMRDKTGLFKVQIGEKIEPIKVTKESIKTYNISGVRVDLLTISRSLNVAGKEYDTVYSLPKAVNIASFTIKGAQEVIDGTLRTIGDKVYKGKLTDVIIEDGKITQFKIEVPSDKIKIDSEGNKIYTLRGEEGTKEELLILGKERGWTDGYINRNADPVKETDKTKTILAPASENKSLAELFRIQGISEIGESVKTASELTQSEWNAKWAKLKSGETLVGADGNTYTKK